MTPTRWSSAASIAVSLTLAACAPTRLPAANLDARVALSELREVRVTAPKDGLSADNAVAIALVHNLDLRALRRERQIAEGAVLSASAWKNPELRFGLQQLLSGNPIEFFMGLRFFPPPPGQHDAMMERAKAHERRVLAEIEVLEMHVAAATRLEHARLLQLRETRRLLDGKAVLNERLVKLQQDRIQASVATRLDLIVALLEQVDVERDRSKTALDERRALSKLADLMGVADVDVPLRADAACVPSELLSNEALENIALRRPDLRALKELYEEREQMLRLEDIARTPWSTFVEPRISRIGKTPGLDFSGGIEIPLTTDPGLVAEAERLRVRDEYLARLQSVRVEIRTARAQFNQMATRRRYVSESVEPILALAEESLRAGLDSGEVDPVRAPRIPASL